MDDLQDLIESLSREFVRLAIECGATFATAESCTAGMIASRVADVPGASSVLKGGAVTYCDQIKRDVLGVSGKTLLDHSAVSAECALEMAQRARCLFGSTVAVSATGYAGPGGGTPSDPAGTVYIGVCGPHGTHCERFRFTGTRDEVRERAVAEALRMALGTVSSM